MHSGYRLLNPKADPATTVRSRRSALRFGGTATVAGLMTPLTSLAAAYADAELIRLCNRVLSLWAKMEALYRVRRTLADEIRTEPMLEQLYRENEIAVDRIDDTGGPTTLVGARAMAETSLALAPRNNAGDLLFHGNAEWLAFCVAEFLVEKTGA
jgi:hypothetical protein